MKQVDQSESADPSPDSAQDGGSSAPNGVPASDLAREITALQAFTRRALRKRSRLPQPLFWSLFSSRIKEIKAKKHSRRLMRSLLGDIGE